MLPVKGLKLMRHYGGMKAIPCLLLCFAFCAAADDAADRAAIERVIASLNVLPRASAFFTADASSDLDRLPNLQDVSAVKFRPILPSDDPAVHPSLTISHEIWGEAKIDFPGASAEILNPRIACASIRFITSDVALGDGNWTYENGPETQTTPLLFVMKEEAGNWKIASIRLLAPRPAK